ncbi:MAG: LLM class flavin-dependent oxidoreductase, partial [Nitrososphaerota archaeon]|nr:LLM class flavin-dependent oxidoreductase [Nitrososphaerota archaeon]
MNRNLGVTVSWQGATVPCVRSVALSAEELGFEYLWVPEAWGLDATTTIAHLLTVTSSIKIGTGILNVYSRSAALIGMTCATLEQISPGRILLGLGTSGKSLVEDWHGVQFARSLQRTKEYVEVIRKVATGEKVEFEGELLRLARFRLYTKPCSPPPIFLGAIGEKNLKLAGKISDGAIVATYPLSK